VGDPGSMHKSILAISEGGPDAGMSFRLAARIAGLFGRAQTVVAYCASDGRSALIGKTLKDMGYTKVMNLGGFKGWVDAGGEVEKG
jgi:rhodanese-related sulfurtransferase